MNFAVHESNLSPQREDKLPPNRTDLRDSSERENKLSCTVIHDEKQGTARANNALHRHLTQAVVREPCMIREARGAAF